MELVDKGTITVLVHRYRQSPNVSVVSRMRHSFGPFLRQ
jgi:hypothetical protein